MFHSVSLLSQKPLARGSCALPSVLLSKLTWNLTWNGASPFADQTSRMQNWKEVNVWSSTVYSCDFHEGRQHFITLLMFVLNFVLFFNLFTLVIFMKVDNISSHC